MSAEVAHVREPVWLRGLQPAQVAMLARLQRWVKAGWVRELDQVFAVFLAREAADADPLLLLGAALASHQLGRGHACLELQAALDDAGEALALPPEGLVPVQELGSPAAEGPSALLAGLDVDRWERALRHRSLVSDGEGTSPLVLVDGRLYLRRYWEHERAVRACMQQRLSRTDARADAGPELRDALTALFPPGPDQPASTIDWQRVACALATRSFISVVTGGPGTGKTTTVVKVLAVLQHLAMCEEVDGLPGRPLRIRLAAPTGKAAARLNESITSAVQMLPLDRLSNADALRAAIPTEVTTVHRLLGSLPDSRHFRHDKANLLPLDVLVLDEASMVDLEMVAAVLQALPADARLILLGDKDQLASVEAGAVLGELCRRADQGHYTPATRDWLLQVSGQVVPEDLVDVAGRSLDQVIVKLRHSWRFRSDSGIGQLAAAVNAGCIDEVRRVATAGRSDLAFVQLGDDATLLDRLVIDGAAHAFPRHGQGREVQGVALEPPKGYRHYLEVLRNEMPPPTAAPQAFDAWAQRVLVAYGQFQLLCAVRRGPQGVESLNLRIAQMLFRQGLIEAAQGWYVGRPVMVTRNDYSLGLMNGDVGVTLALPVPMPGGGDPEWKLRVAFIGGGAGRPVHWVLPNRLQDVETVFAMTVHKSQGSEFQHAALVLPDRDSRVLTRELVYTGITRARHWFTLASAGAPDILERAVAKRMRRAGGPLHE